jgi:D-alanyl-D-alanine carboxypeptidase
MVRKNNILVIFSCLFFIVSCKEDKIIEPSFYDCNFAFSDTSALNFNDKKYQGLLDEITGSGVPGILMCIFKPTDGLWIGASGNSDLKNNTCLKSCNITRTGSTVKSFTAVTILKLVEEGKLSLDDKASDYLSALTVKNIENADIATIRQLLNHSSGIYNYIQNLQFQTASLNDLIKEWQPDELLKYARNKSAYFKPGQDVNYSNTNYILLGKIIETIEGKPFYEVFKDKLFIPLNLTLTSFAATDHVPDGIIRGYVDIYSNLNVTDATYYSGWDYYTADGGLISNPYDLFVFLKSIMDEEIISSSSYEEMTKWIMPKNQDPEFFDIYYGLGLFKMDTPYGEAYFHSGDAIGYYAIMLYLPGQKTYIVWAVNGNYGKIDNFTMTREAIEKIIGTILE